MAGQKKIPVKKVLIILYYWPPSGGMAVQRWLKFSKYLPGYGWEPVIYAPENAAYSELDPTLEQEVLPGTQVIRRPILEPHHFYQKFLGNKKESGIGVSMALKEKPSAISHLKNNLSLWLRGNLFIPDARVLWVRPSVRYLKDYLAKKPVDVIVTTGTPHSMHLIGKKLHRLTGIPWVADFRDLWTKIDFYADLKLTWLADHLHHRLEKSVVQSANHVIAVGELWKEEFQRIGAREVTVITNGYDPEDLPSGPPEPDKKFSLVHVGSIGKNRNFHALWKVLADKAGKEEDFRHDLEIKLIGSLDYSVTESIRSFGLEKNLNRIEYLPHPEAMKCQQNAQVLLLLINRSADARGRLTGKIFEYLASRRPILVIGPENGEAARLIESVNGGYVVGFEDEKKLAGILDGLYRRYRDKTLVADPVNPEQFSRKMLTGKLADLLDNTTMKKLNQK